MKLDVSNLFADEHTFESGHLSVKEFEKMLRDTVAQEHPLDPIKSFDYTDDGVVIQLDSGEAIEVQVDWQEFLLE